MGVTDAGAGRLLPSSSRTPAKRDDIGNVPSPVRKRHPTPRIAVEKCLRDREDREIPKAGISLLWKTPLWRAIVVNGFQLLPIAISVPLWNRLSVDQFGHRVYQMVTLDDIIVAVISLSVNAAWCQLSSPSSYGRRSLLAFTGFVETILLFVLATTQNYGLFFVVRSFAYLLGGSIPSRVHSAVLAGWVADWCPKQSRVAAISYLQGMTSSFFAVSPLLGGFLLRYLQIRPKYILLGAAVAKCAHPFLAWALMRPIQPRGNYEEEDDEEVLFAPEPVVKGISAQCSPETSSHRRRPRYAGSDGSDLESGVSINLAKTKLEDDNEAVVKLSVWTTGSSRVFASPQRFGIITAI